MMKKIEEVRCNKIHFLTMAGCNFGMSHILPIGKSVENVLLQDKQCSPPLTSDFKGCIELI